MSDARRREVRAALEEGRRRLAAAGVADPLREAEVLLAAALGVERASLHVDPPALEGAPRERWLGFLGRREAREPAAYVLGRCEFRSREFAVGPAVLVPRPETEHLVEAALAAIPEDAPVRVVDVGTGSGCIAVSLAAERPLAAVAAVDRSAAALEVARGNARRHGVRVAFLRGDLLAAFRGPVDLVVSNPPYVATGDTVDPEVLREPPEALFAGPDGLDAYRRLAPDARRILRPGGLLLLETPETRGDALAAILRAAGFAPEPPIPDLAGLPRVLAARGD